jgi:signal transduction histidine kinase
VSAAGAWVEDDRPGRRGLLVDLAGALAFGALAVLVGAAQSGWSALAGGLLAAAFAVRRVRWWAAVALAVAAGLVQVVVGDLNVVADLAFAPVAFTLGSHRSSAVRRLGLLACGLGVVGAAAWAGVQATGARATSGPALSAAGMATAAALVLGGGWVAGYVRWQRREGLRALLDGRLRAAEERRLRDLVALEQERVRIAADMHDVIAHSWAVVAAQADGARYAMRTDPDAAEAALGVIGETARGAMTDVRGLLGRLRDPELAEADPDLGDADELVARMQASGMTVDVHREGAPDPGSAVADAARRVLAEALTNALKHGDLSAPVRVEEAGGPVHRLTVTNAVAGPGAPGAPAAPGEGHGLQGMRERVLRAGGRLSAGPTADGRWVVDVELPRDGAS